MEEGGGGGKNRGLHVDIWSRVIENKKPFKFQIHVYASID